RSSPEAGAMNPMHGWSAYLVLWSVLSGSVLSSVAESQGNGSTTGSPVEVRVRNLWVSPHPLSEADGPIECRLDAELPAGLWANAESETAFLQWFVRLEPTAPMGGASAITLGPYSVNLSDCSQPSDGEEAGAGSVALAMSFDGRLP